MATPPQPGSLGQKRQRKWWRFSSWVGAANAVRSYVEAHGSREYLRNLETANTAKLADDYFRTCIADDARRRYLCLFVDTKKQPPEVVRDPSTLPNRREATGP